MTSLHAQAIRAARKAAGLTQEELGRRIGINGRAIYRWERGSVEPTRRNRSALVTTITLVDAEAGKQLRAALDGAPNAAPLANFAPPAPPSPDVTLQLALLAFADNLDVPPRRARAALIRFCKQLEHTALTVDALRARMARVLSDDEASTTPTPN